ncbi:soluble scavenger receptor cysteine-rich domain-containing protein SSC5D-like isoform X2 [Melopsittacus undulatus]|uniref:soluble scavenger receptor cysteine-rich domain-containing protein SSC5D-like isoform X2 n=1 Tax=Melopsittacus undulatus TaxID=13146 RepID=UPI00146BEAD3|nr:soluble scavenger receptor cysteine-rich domain-containing protein SSC5D-like isoform X2 [Melopsittacus undulatus]
MEKSGIPSRWELSSSIPSSGIGHWDADAQALPPPLPHPRSWNGSNGSSGNWAALGRDNPIHPQELPHPMGATGIPILPSSGSLSSFLGSRMGAMLFLLAWLGGAAIRAPIRLVGGPNRCVGRLEVLWEQQWGSVCDDQWGMPDATVVCRQLGCGDVLSAPGSAPFGPGAGPIWLDDVDCNGTEEELLQCRMRPWGEHNCDHGEDAGVVCSGPPSPVPVQLVNGSSRCSGTVQVLYGQHWGTVCDDGWDLRDAEVVCRQLGCGSALSAPPAASFGMGPDPIWLDDVDCEGTEAALSQCKARPWGSHNCVHREDAAVVCADHAEPAPLRLMGGSEPCSGRVEVFYGQQWGTVCDDGWDLEDADVVCRQLGCGRAMGAPHGAAYGEGSGPIWLDDVACNGNEEALVQCEAPAWGSHNCEHREDAGVVCTGGI